MPNPEESVHAFDQMGAVINNMAVLLGDYFKKLQQQGFSREEAFEMTLECQQVLLLGASGRNRKEADA